jgi:hypothetical protein
VSSHEFELHVKEEKASIDRLIFLILHIQVKVMLFVRHLPSALVIDLSVIIWQLESLRLE